MKKRFVVIVVLTLLIVSACSPVAQSTNTPLPPELVGVVGMVLLFLITAALKWLGGLIGIDLTDRAAEIASAVAAILVLVINWALGLIPEAYDTLVNAIFAFLIILLGGNGLYGLFFRKKNR